MSDIKDWATTAGGNGFGVPDGWPEGMVPSGVNDSARENMAAVRRFYDDSEFRNIHSGATIVKNTAQQFSVLAGDHTSFYTTGRRIRVVGDTTAQFHVASSVFSGGNTVVNTTAATVPENPTEVGVHQSPSLGNAAFVDQGSGNGLDADTVDGIELAGLVEKPGGLTTGDLLQWSGSSFIPVSPAVSYAEVTTAQDISMNFGAPSEGAAWTTVTSLTSTITVPSTGQYYIRVHMTVAGRALPGGGQEFVWFDTVLFENKDAAGAVEKGRQRNAGRDIFYGPGAQNSLGYVVVPATPGSTYVYTVGARAATGAAGATWRISGSHGIAPNEGDMASTLIAELIPYTT